MVAFDFSHYVPVLRWKRAEKVALERLGVRDASRLMPLIEYVPDRFQESSGSTHLPADVLLARATEDLHKHWPHRPLLLDLGLLDTWLPPQRLSINGGRHAFDLVGDVAKSLGVQLVPVTGLQRTPLYQQAVRDLLRGDQRGLCLRLVGDEINQSSPMRPVDELLSYFRISPEQVDLVLDCQQPDWAGFSHSRLCFRIPYLDRWRSFTVLSGAFPRDLSHLRKNNQYELPRCDWTAYCQVVEEPRLGRRPSFGDYTIQYPDYAPPIGQMRVSASIRYTYEDYWVVMRGEWVGNPDGPGYQGYLGNAQLLCDRSEFCGAEFSFGDRYLWERAQPLDKTGNAETWLRAGINHHLAFVVRQIASHL